jgi:hypothetical protein
MNLPDVPAQDSSHLFLTPPNAMTIVALERQTLHEKIARLRAVREASEAEKVRVTQVEHSGLQAAVSRS